MVPKTAQTVASIVMLTMVCSGLGRTWPELDIRVYPYQLLSRLPLITSSPHASLATPRCARQVLTGGFFVVALPGWIAWLKWLSYIYYALGVSRGSYFNWNER